MKFILLLTLVLSAPAYAQDDNKNQRGSEYQESHGQAGGMQGSGDGKEGGMHGDGHEGGMHGGHGHEGDEHSGGHGHEGGMHGGGHDHGDDDHRQ